MISRALFLLATFLTVAQVHAERSYREQLNYRPFPTTAAQTQEECAWIKEEMARLDSMVLFAETTSTLHADNAEGWVRDAKAALTHRASKLKCQATFSASPANVTTP